MKKPHSGRGTVIAFNTTRAGFFLNFQRSNGLEANLIIAPDVATALADTYGVRDRRGAEALSLKSLRGAAFLYRESAMGTLVYIAILAN
jgi:hypothetical protein